MFHGFIFWLLTQNRAFKFLDKEKLWKFWIFLQEYGYSTWLLCDIPFKNFGPDNAANLLSCPETILFVEKHFTAQPKVRCFFNGFFLVLIYI